MISKPKDLSGMTMDITKKRDTRNMSGNRINPASVAISGTRNMFLATMASTSY
jgi:hypothetical protein